MCNGPSLQRRHPWRGLVCAVLPLAALFGCTPETEVPVAELPTPYVEADYDTTFEVLDVWLWSADSQGVTSAGDCTYPASDIAVDVDGTSIPLLAEGGWLVGGGSANCAAAWYQLDPFAHTAVSDTPSTVTLSDASGSIEVAVSNLTANRTAQVTAPTADVIAPGSSITVEWLPETDQIIELEDVWLWDEASGDTIEVVAPVVSGTTLTLQLPDAFPSTVVELSILAEVAFPVTSCGAATCDVQQAVRVDVPVSTVAR